MGGKLKTRGVELRDSSIRISFQFQGKRCRETLLLDPAKDSDRKHAARILKSVNDAIQAGTFEYSEFFPDSKRLKPQPDVQPHSTAHPSTFADIASDWLDGLTIEKGTRDKYRQDTRFWAQVLRDFSLKDLDYPVLRKVIGDYAWPSAKTRNNRLSSLRGILGHAVDLGLISENPAVRIRNARYQKQPPDPLSPEEVGKVLEYMARNFDPAIVNYFQTAFWTGMRPEELIALKWVDVDFDYDRGQGVINVVRARSAGQDKGTKTHQARLVRINSHSRAALKRQQALSGEQEYVFYNPGTGRRWNSEKFQRELYWNPALAACGIRPRFCYQTRHTFASMSLSQGVMPLWLASQMGHTSPKMVYERYARWIDAAGNSTEHTKIESMMTGLDSVFVPEMSLKTGGD